MVKRYVDFELQLSSTEEQIAIDINGRPYAINLPKPITVPLKCQPVDWEKLSVCPAKDIATLGHSLYTQFFVQEVESRFQAYLNRRETEEGVRLCVYTQSNDLGKAAWEILCSQLMPAISFLALDPRTPVVRSPRIGREVYLREMRTPLRLLVILASPRLVQKIDQSKEKSSIEQALGKAIEQGQIKKPDYLGFDDPTEANFDRLQEYLANQEIQYDVVHIIGHGLLEAGQEGVTAMVQPGDGKQQDVIASSLANLFRLRGVMLVIMQSCQSGAVAPSKLGLTPFSSTAQQLVASGVPAVLAMQETIDQDVATYFINRLYAQWLGAGCPFEDALTQARQCVYQKFPKQIALWAIPVLYICPGVQLLLSETFSPPEKKERQVEAALPQKARVGKETELVVLVRTPAMPGLREILSAQPRDFDAKPEDVRTSSTFEVLFPVDKKTGKALPTSVRIVVETSDFDLTRSEDKVQVRPQGDSVYCIFYVIPKREGDAKLLVRVLDSQAQVTLAQLPLKTEVQRGNIFESEYRVIDADAVKMQITMEAERIKEPKAKLKSRDILEKLESPLAEMLETLQYLSQMLHMILPTREHLALSQKYLQNLTTLLSEKEVESDLLQQITALGESLRTFEAEFPEERYKDIAKWHYEFWKFLHRLGKELGRERLSDLLINASAGIKGLEAFTKEFRCPGCGVFLPPFLFYTEPFWDFWGRCPSCGYPLKRYYREYFERIFEKLKDMISNIPRSIRFRHDIDNDLYELKIWLRRESIWWPYDSRANRLLRRLEKIIDELKRCGY